MLREKSYNPNEPKKEHKPKNKGDKIFIIIYTIFLILLIYFTFLGVYFTIQRINENIANGGEAMSVTDIIFNEIKKSNADTRYTINSYIDTYDSNSLKIVNNYDIDGTVTTEPNYDNNHKSMVNFIQIDGLKNKDIQYKINEKLKSKAYVLAFNDSYVSSYVTANFSNILSVLMYNSKTIDTYNVDLSTGDEIKLEDLFISSATINAYLANALYETLAWYAPYNNSDDMDGINDMSKIDTSEYEDKFMMLIKNYNKAKNNLKFTISANSIQVYGLIDKDILNVEQVENLNISIDLLDHMDEVTLFKKYVTNKSLFEDDSLGLKNTIVFTPSMENNEYATRMNYGKLQNNIFLEEVLMTFGEFDDTLSVAKDYIKNLSEDQKANLINQTSNSKGTFYQREYSIGFNTEKNYYNISVNSYQAMCSLDYFRNDAFLDYIKLKALPRADSGLNGFADYLAEDFPNLEILPSKYETIYISTTGEFLGNTIEEADETVRIKKEKEEQERLEQERLEQERLQQFQREQEQLQQQNTISNTVNETTVTNSVDTNVVAFYDGYNYIIY